MDYERTKAKLAAHPATEQGRVNRSSPGMEIEIYALNPEGTTR
jgi:hypothetical protein